MLLTFLGLGGGGTKVAQAFYQWCEKSFSATDVAKASEYKEDRGGWLYSHVHNPANHVGFAVLDSFTGDKVAYSGREGFPAWATYKVADEDGFGGDYLKGFQTIKLTNEELKRRSDKRLLPMGRFLSESLRFRSSDMNVLCFSLVGGTGRAVYEVLVEEWAQVFARNPTTLLVCVTPSLAELGGNRELLESARAYTSRLSAILKRKRKLGCVIMSYDLAHASYVQASNQRFVRAIVEDREGLGIAIQQGSKDGAKEKLHHLATSGPRGARMSLAVDEGAVRAIVPLLANGLGPLAGPPAFRINEYPRPWDPADAAHGLGGHITVPCYAEASGTFDDCNTQYGSEISRFRSLRSVGVNCLTVLTHRALTVGSYLPFNIMPRDGAANLRPPERLRNVVRVIAMVWSSQGLHHGDALGISDYFRRFHKVNAEVYYIDGSDPVVWVTPGSNSGDRIRLWLYVVLSDDSIVQDYYSLM